jgi:hypothetical protein
MSTQEYDSNVILLKGGAYLTEAISCLFAFGAGSWLLPLIPNLPSSLPMSSLNQYSFLSTFTTYLSVLLMSSFTTYLSVLLMSSFTNEPHSLSLNGSRELGLPF